LFILCATVVGVGPTPWPLGTPAENAVGPTERRLLPAAQSLSELGDLWFLPAVSLQPGGAGLELFDPQRLAVHGWAWSQLRSRLNGLDITDPARPGEALFEVPYNAWESVELASLWSAQPGFNFTLLPAELPGSRAAVGLQVGQPVGGGPWVPAQLFDRDPSFAFGAPTDRRALRRAGTGYAAFDALQPSVQLRAVGEVLRHQHHYITLQPPENAQRATALLSVRLQQAVPWTLTLGWQQRQRQYEGAQARFEAPLTAAVRSHSAVAQAHTCLGGGALCLDVGAAWRDDQEAPNSRAPQVTDLVDTWLTLQRPRLYGHLRRLRLDAIAEARLSDHWQLRSRLSHAVSLNTPHIPGGRTEQTYAHQLLRTRLYDAPQTAQQRYLGLRTDLTYGAAWGAVRLEVFAGLDIAGFATPQPTSTDLSFATPTAGAALRTRLGAAGEVYALLRREPWSLDATVGNFLDGRSPSATEVDGSGLPVGHSGGAYHGQDPTLLRPLSHQAAVGYRSPALGPFVLSIQGIGRLLSHRFTVERSSRADEFSVLFTDPGGDGRGEASHVSQAGQAGGGQVLRMVVQSPQTLRNQSFVLQNDAQAATYLGFEFNLVSAQQTWWFVNLGGSAYLSQGGAPFGNFADRNDPGALDESSASPNAQLHATGRYDRDRAYTLKLLAGVMPLPQLSLAVVGRYRDGQPFTRVVVNPNLPQGPTAAMAVDRGEPRHTFAMTWDARLRYEVALLSLRGGLTVDVFNLLGSATEILEDPRTGPTFRRAVEAVPGRAVLVGLEIALVP
jgi:hypothetical protein